MHNHLTTNFLDIKLTDVLTLLVSMLTLLLAYRIYRNFDVKKAHTAKQLETVFGLIEAINQTLIPVKFHKKIPEAIMQELGDKLNFNSIVDSWHFSLFKISTLSRKDLQYKGVYLGAKVTRVLPFLSYINNPLLPKGIAQKLSCFYSPITSYGSFDTVPENYVELCPLIKSDFDTGFQLPDANTTYKSWENFIAAAAELRNEIECWLKKYGSTDINFNFYLQTP